MKFVALVSSGIDSPVATYMLARKGDDIILVHADNTPYTDNRDREKFTRITHHLKKLVSGSLQAYIVPHGQTLAVMKKNCKAKFTCILCKRMLLRYAEKIAKREHADALIMGDSLGQVASQTLHNIHVVEQAVQMPVLRPLIGFDKEDITRIAKKIGTYELSILPAQGCTAVPKKPSTQARLDDVITEETKINVADLVEQAIKNAELLFSE